MTNTATPSAATPTTGTRTTGTPPSIAQLVDTHLEAYCEPNRARRGQLVASVWSVDGQLVDPPFDGAGLEAISAMGEVVLEHYPDHRFERTTDVDVHHTCARYGWSLISPDGVAAVTGTDVVDLDPDGRIQRIVGFFGELSPRGLD